MEDVINKCKVIYERFWEGNQPKLEIKSDALNKIEKLVYELVRERLSL